MLKKWLIYIASLILALFLSIMYYEPFPVLCLLLLVIVPIIGALIQLPLIRFIDIRLSAFDVVCETGDGIQVKFFVNNRSVLPIFHFRIYVQTENELSGHIQNQYVDMRLLARNNIVVPLSIYSEDCGSIRIKLEKAQIMGIIPIYSCTFSNKKVQNEVRMTVLPRIQKLSMTIGQDTRKYQVDCESLKIKKETVQIYKVRPFQPGDRLQRIHWKLSAKNDEWMIREIITPQGANVILVMDWKRKSFENLNQIMEVMISLAFGLARESCKAFILSSTNSGEWYTMNSEEDLYLIFGGIMQQKIVLDDKRKKQKINTSNISNILDDVPLLSMLEQKCVGVTFSHIYYVTDNLEEEVITLLGTSHVAYKKTFICVQENNSKHLDTLLEQYKIEYFCMDKRNKDLISQWDLIV